MHKIHNELLKDLKTCFANYNAQFPNNTNNINDNQFLPQIHIVFNTYIDKLNIDITVTKTIVLFFSHFVFFFCVCVLIVFFLCTLVGCERLRSPIPQNRKIAIFHFLFFFIFCTFFFRDLKNVNPPTI